MSMTAADKGQVSRSAADIYDEFFVPALFAEWPPRVCDAAMIKSGDHVLDVACGTGILAREAARRAGPDGQVTGVDINDGMLTAARKHSTEIDWQAAPAEALPFEDGTFDAAVSQFGLMFFEDRVKALQEMMRVLREDGRLSVAVWASLDDTPGYSAMVGLIGRLFGAAVADALRAPYVLGDTADLHALLAQAGLDGAKVETLPGTARFPSIEAWVHTDVRGWTLADLIDDDQYQTLLAAAQSDLHGFVGTDGTVSFDSPAHIIRQTK